MHTYLNPLRKKLILLALLILAPQSLTNISAEEINIKINGEEYSREMPEDLESAKQLIKSMSNMINNADSTIVKLQTEMNIQSANTSERISSLENKLSTVENELANANKKLADSEKGVNSLVNMNTKNTPFLILGPTIGSDMSVGFHFMLGTEYRLFRNLHVGGTIFSTVYTNTNNRIFDIGAGLVLGYSIR